MRQAIKKILPFHPTGAQKRVLKEIVDDTKAAYPMIRLLQGDVGSGKTIVALEAIVVAVSNGYQAALMAPTEILAEQHFLNAKRILAPLNYRIGAVRRGIKKAERQELLEKIAVGEIDIVIGTHALIEEHTVFRKLGLVIIDEQHRFGVIQRLQLMAKGENPNTLVMTATPIPRTLAMAIYGDLDLSVIDEMPPGRSPIRTIHAFERDAQFVNGAINPATGKMFDRNSFRAGGLFSWDMRFSKNFNLGGPRSIELMFDVFNITNHANFNRDDYFNKYGSANFGQPSDVLPNSQFQSEFGLRFKF